MILHLFVPFAVRRSKHFSSLERICIKLLISHGKWLFVMCLHSLCVCATEAYFSHPRDTGNGTAGIIFINFAVLT